MLICLNKTLLKNRQTITAVVPAFLAHAVYTTVYFLFYIYMRPYLKKYRCKLWHRHGLKMKSIQFLYSDIDLSILIPEDLSKNDFHKILQRIHFFHQWIPLFPDLNYYVPQQLNLTAKYMNFYELQNDPILLQKIPVNPSEDSIEKIVFLMRALKTDGSMLNQNPRVRFRKWRRHYKSLLDRSLIISDLNLNFVVNDLVQLFPIPAEQQSEVQKQLLQFFLNPESSDGFLTSPWLWAAFPYIGFYSDHKCLPLTDFQKKIFRRQMHWELFGMLTQHRKKQDNMSLPLHLELLMKALESSKSALGDEFSLMLHGEIAEIHRILLNDNERTEKLISFDGPESGPQKKYL